jgi:hypothetical protein
VTYKRRKFAIAALLCVGVVAIISFLNHENEPRHKGKSLSQWLDVYVKNAENAKGAEAAFAVRTVGTNALPYLLKWIQYEPPAWRASLQAAVPSKIKDSVLIQSLIAGRAGKRSEYGSAGFEILGTNAVATVPELETLIKKTNAPITVLRSLSALVRMGEPSLPVFERALADKNQMYRNQIPWWLREMADRDGSTAYLPLMRQALTNDDRTVRENAAELVDGMEMQ